MKDIKKILCAVDIYDFHTDSINSVKALAAALSATVTPVYVVADLPDYVGFTEPKAEVNSMEETLAKGAHKDFDAFMKKHFADSDAKGVLLKGKPAEELLAYIAKSKADMVIMVTHGRKGVERMLYGSVAERIVKYSPVPVLTLKMPAEASKQ